MPASNFRNIDGGKRVRATGADFNLAPKSQKPRTHPCLENHVGAGVGHEDAGHTALGAQVGRPASTPGGAFNQPASKLFPTAKVIFEVERAFRSRRCTHLSGRYCWSDAGYVRTITGVDTNDVADIDKERHLNL